MRLMMSPRSPSLRRTLSTSSAMIHCRGAERRGEAEALQLAGAAQEQRPLELAGLVAVGAQVDYAVVAGGVARERLVERHPAIGVDLPLETAADLLFAARTKLPG